MRQSRLRQPRLRPSRRQHRTRRHRTRRRQDGVQVARPLFQVRPRPTVLISATIGTSPCLCGFVSCFHYFAHFRQRAAAAADGFLYLEIWSVASMRSAITGPACLSGRLARPKPSVLPQVAQGAPIAFLRFRQPLRASGSRVYGLRCRIVHITRVIDHDAI